MIAPVFTLPKEWFEELAKANFDLMKAYMDGFEAGKKAAAKVTDGAYSTNEAIQNKLNSDPINGSESDPNEES